MKICLINPRLPLSLWDFSYSRDIDGNAFPFPAVIPFYLSRFNSGKHEVVICDENVKPVDFDTDVDIVGITGYHIQKERVYQLADSFRSKGKNCGPRRAPRPKIKSWRVCGACRYSFFWERLNIHGRHSYAIFNQAMPNLYMSRKNLWI